MADGPADVEEHRRRGFLGRFGRGLERHRMGFQFAGDVIAWAAGLSVAMVLRYEFTFDPSGWGSFGLGNLAAAVLVAGAFQLASGVAGGLYLGRYRFGSFDEVLHLVRTVLVASVGLCLVNKFLPHPLVPLSVAIMGALMALLLMAGLRYTWRLVLERSLRPSADAAARVIVFGAGMRTTHGWTKPASRIKRRSTAPPPCKAMAMRPARQAGLRSPLDAACGAGR